MERNEIIELCSNERGQLGLPGGQFKCHDYLVIRTGKTGAVVEKFDGVSERAYLDHIKLTLTPLTDRDRCSSCGNFCMGECREQTISSEIIDLETETVDMKPIPISEVQQMSEGDKISCVEGVITTWKEAKSGSGWHHQGCVLTDNDQVEIRVDFCDKSLAQPSSIKGKRIHIEGGMKFKGPTEKDGKTYSEQIEVGKGAKITFIGGAVSTGGSAPAQSSGARSSSQSTEKPTPVKERVGLYFKVLREVGNQYDEILKENPTFPVLLQPESLKDIATHISMTYKGDYGVYSKPIFEVAGAVDPGFDWRSVPHKDGKTMGERDEETLKKIAIWAFPREAPDPKENVELVRKAAIAAAREFKWTPQSLIEGSLGDLEGFKPEFLQEVIDDNLKDVEPHLLCKPENMKIIRDNVTGMILENDDIPS